MSQAITASPSARLPRIGEEAPDFELRDQHGQDVRLSSYRQASKVLLVFYPSAFTGTCSRELTELQQHLGELSERGVAVLAISVDSMYSQRVFADREGFSFRLLADFWPHGAVAKSYGIFDESSGVALRGTFLIDGQGVVRWSVVSDMGQARRMADYLDALSMG